MRIKIKYNGLGYIFENQREWELFWKLLEQKTNIETSMGAYRE